MGFYVEFHPYGPIVKAQGHNVVLMKWILVQFTFKFHYIDIN